MQSAVPRIVKRRALACVTPEVASGSSDGALAQPGAPLSAGATVDIRRGDGGLTSSGGERGASCRNDMLLMADAPAHHLLVMLPPINAWLGPIPLGGA